MSRCRVTGIPFENAPKDNRDVAGVMSVFFDNQRTPVVFAGVGVSDVDIVDVDEAEWLDVEDAAWESRRAKFAGRTQCQFGVFFVRGSNAAVLVVRNAPLKQGVRHPERHAWEEMAHAAMAYTEEVPLASHDEELARQCSVVAQRAFATYEDLGEAFAFEVSRFGPHVEIRGREEFAKDSAVAQLARELMLHDGPRVRALGIPADGSGFAVSGRGRDGLEELVSKVVETLPADNDVVIVSDSDTGEFAVAVLDSPHRLGMRYAMEQAMVVCLPQALSMSRKRMMAHRARMARWNAAEEGGLG